MSKNILLKFKKIPLKIVDEKPLFIPEEDFKNIEEGLHSGFLNRFKTFLKRFPQIYSFIFYFIAPAIFLGREPKSIFSVLNKDSLIIDLGSGNRRLSKNIVNVDIHPWSEVDILADAHDLPFEDNSVDGVVLSG